MSKILFGIILALSTIIVFGSWRYSVALESLGEFEQANRQLESTIESLSAQQQRLVSQREKENQQGLQHHEKALAILHDEMLTKLALKQHKIDQLQTRIKKLKKKKQSIKISGIIDAAHAEEVSDESLPEKCAELPIPDFYLKQL